MLAQVNEINKNVDKDKNNTTNNNQIEGNYSYKKSNENSRSLGAGLIYFVGEVFINTIGAAQRVTLQHKGMYPERISLDALTTFGTEISSSANYFETGIRGNWGIFGSDFRYSELNDYTGNLKSIDWLVLVVRIPIKKVKLDYGLGYIDLIDLDQSYLKSSIGFDWILHTLGININSAYQWSEQTSLGTRYKKNFHISLDFNVYNHNHFFLSPQLKYSYQNYFNETEFSIFSAGVVLRLL